MIADCLLYSHLKNTQTFESFVIHECEAKLSILHFCYKIRWEVRLIKKFTKKERILLDG